MRKHLVFALLLLLPGVAARAQLSLDTLSALTRNPGIYSLVISQKDRIVYEKYFNGGGPDTLFNDQSLTKSICSILTGIAIDKGFIRSVDQPLADFFPELKKDTDRRKQAITLRQLMNQASGFVHEDLERLGEYLRLPDPSGYVLHAPLVSDPGDVFHYNNAASHLLSVILTKSTGMDTRSFAKKFLFDPLGITRFDWAKMKDGYYDGCGLLSIRLRTTDMIKIGLLVLHDGRYKDRQIVSSRWIQEVLRPTVFYPTEWGLDHSTYALCWYHVTYRSTAITYGLGWGGQFLLVIPSRQAVIAINESIEDATAIRRAATFLYRIFPVIFEQLGRLR